AVSSFLSYPSPPARAETLKPKSSGRVLTSTENLALVKEKERQKEEKQRKEEERERKKKEREEAKYRDTMKVSLGQKKSGVCRKLAGLRRCRQSIYSCDRDLPSTTYINT
ncbi:hypothetical protein GBAR_LOCUS28545, partial [Geodia barretti]